MVIQLNPLAKDLKIKVPDLITRPVGKKMYEAIVQRCTSCNNGETIVIDFDGIKVIDSSFIDELLVKLLVSLWTDERHLFVKIKNISEIAQINIDLVFKNYSHYNKRRIAVRTDALCSGNNGYYIGPLTMQESEVVNYLQTNKVATIEELTR